MQKISTEVLIAGCGPVGLSLANCLAKSNYISSITLLDRKLPSKTRPLPQVSSQRVFSINGPSLKLLDNLNALPLIRQKGLMSQVQVVSKQSLSFLNWTDNNANVIENDQLVYSLYNSLNSHSKIRFVQDEITKINQKGSHSSISLKSDSSLQIQTKLVVGSDGIASNVKKISGIPHYGWQYRQKAIVCTMKIENSFENTSAYQIYHDGNVLALLPLWNSYVSLVWSLGLPDFQHLMQISDEQFRKKLNNVIRNSNYNLQGKIGYKQIPQIQQIMNKRLSFPLATLQSANYTQERVALVGDAAHTIHPMAGLGVNSGIMDSILLANNIIKNIKTGNDIGDLMALSQYEAKSKLFNYKNSLGMQSIKKAFQIDYWITNKLRGLGMDFAHKSSQIKQILKEAVDEKVQYEWQIA